MKTLAINIGKGHICCTDSQMVVWLYAVYGCAKLVREVMSDIRQGRGVPLLCQPSKNTHKARVQLAQTISLCAARYEGRTGKWLGNPAIAANWNIG